MDEAYKRPPTPPPPPPPLYPSPSFNVDGNYPSIAYNFPHSSQSLSVEGGYVLPPTPPPPPPPSFSTGVPVSYGTVGYPPGTVFMHNGPRRPVPWSTGLFDCSDDVGNCCVTCMCPCVTFGQIAEIVDHGSTSCCTGGFLYMMILSLTGCHCMYSCFYRSKMRGQFMLEEGPIADCPAHCCCECCALCQEYRELKNRGYDLCRGWEASMNKMDAMIPPEVDLSMKR